MPAATAKVIPVVPEPTNSLSPHRHAQLKACCLALLAALTTQAFFSPVAQAQTDTPAAVAQLQSTLVDVIAKAERSIVAISRTQPPQENAQQRQGFQLNFGDDPFAQLRANQNVARPYAFGAGVIIDPAGLILTQYLVVNPGDVHNVTTIEGQSYPAELKAADPRSGLAILQVQARDLPALVVGRAEELKKGEFVVALSNPQAIISDGQPTASWGIVTNLGRKAAAEDNFNNVSDTFNTYRTTLHHFGTLIQTDARLGWASSGGALVTLDGKMVGLTTTATGIAGHEAPAGYAIPLNEPMRRIIEQLKQGKEVEYGLLGIRFNQSSLITNAPVETGISVDSVFPGGPGAQAGLQLRDMLTHVGDQPVDDSDELQLAVGILPPGSKTTLRYLREGRPLQAEVRVGKYYVNGDKVVTAKPKSWRGLRVDFATAIPAVELEQSAMQGRLDPEGSVAVVEVEPKSVAANAGITTGTFINHVNGQRVATPESFYELVERATGEIKLQFTAPLPGGDPTSQSQEVIVPVSP